MTSAFTLSPLRSAGWAELTRMEDGWVGWRWTWMDLDGIHLGPLPAEAPVATTLWGWKGDRRARWRIDIAPGGGVSAIGALLAVDPSGSVAASVRYAPVSLSSSKRGPAVDDLHGATVELTEVSVPALTFVSVMS